MYDALFSIPALTDDLEPLRKITESHNMNQFMGKDIYEERQKLKLIVSLQGLQYLMVLQTDEIKIPQPGFGRINKG